MSEVFNGTTGYLKIASVGAVYAPTSLSFWFYPTDQVTTVQQLWIAQNAAQTEYLHVKLNGATGVITWRFVGLGGAGPPGPTASGVNFNAWNHVFCQTNGMKLSLNGGTLQTGGADVNTNVINRRRVGASTTGALVHVPAEFFTGQIAELLEVYQELDDINTDYRLRLARGYHPLSVVDQLYAAVDADFSDVRYFPFMGRPKDEFNKTTAWTETNMTYGDNPPKMIYPWAAKKVMRVPPAVVGFPHSFATIMG